MLLYGPGLLKVLDTKTAKRPAFIRGKSWFSPWGHSLRHDNLQVMVLPQRPIVAPGPSLRLQLVYPSADVDSLTDDAAYSLLTRVSLDHLLVRISGDLDAPLAWEGALQRMSTHGTCMVERCSKTMCAA